MKRLCGSALAAMALAMALAGCGGGSSSPAPPSIAPARQYSLAGFQPVAAVRPGKPTVVSFTVIQPNGKPLVDYRTGPGPHTGVHVILVRDDLSHHRPPAPADRSGRSRA